MADGGAPPQTPALDARIARLETDVAEIKATLARLAPRIDEMYGFFTAKLPDLAAGAQLADLRTETKSEIAALRIETKSELADLRLAISLRPTRRQAMLDTFAVVSLIGVILAIASHVLY